MNYLIGAGGHASVIENIANKNEFTLDGVFYDGDIENLTQLEKIGNFECINTNINGNKFMIAFGNIQSRIKLVKSMNNQNAKWFTLVDPSAIVGNNVTIGEGTVIMPGAIINAGAKIGNHVIINSGSIVEHGCIIEDFVHVSPGSVICGNSIIRTGSWVGANSVVVNAIEVSENTTIGAGSVVIKDTEPNTTIAGNPARVLIKK